MATRLDRSSREPLWVQLATDLRRRLATGELTTAVPSEHELVAEYGVSRHTVREALGRLHAEGLLERHRGRGTFATPPALEQPLRSLYSLARTIEEQGLSERSDVLRRDERPAGEAAGPLGIGPEEPVVHLERLRIAGDAPLALDRSWLPASIARPLLSVDLERGSLYEALAHHCGVRVTGGTERIRPVVPDREARRLLELPTGQAALSVERVVRAAGTPVEWRRSLVRGDRYSFTAEWSGEGIAPGGT